MYSNSRVSSRAMAWDSTLGAYWMLEGLAGADLSASRAQASLSDALLKLAIVGSVRADTLWAQFFNCINSVNKHASKMATSVVHSSHSSAQHSLSCLLLSMLCRTPSLALNGTVCASLCSLFKTHWIDASLRPAMALLRVCQAVKPNTTTVIVVVVPTQTCDHCYSCYTCIDGTQLSAHYVT